MTATIEGITTDSDIVHAVCAAANAQGDTTFRTDETGEDVGLMRNTAHGWKVLEVHVNKRGISWAIRSRNADGVTFVSIGQADPTDKIIKYLAAQWQLEL